jgi:hypothetical protein
MSTATTSHHSFSDPLAMAAAALVVVVGGATVIGLVSTLGDSTSPVAPTAPAHGRAAMRGTSPRRTGATSPLRRRAATRGTSPRRTGATSPLRHRAATRGTSPRRTGATSPLRRRAVRCRSACRESASSAPGCGLMPMREWPPLERLGFAQKAVLDNAVPSATSVTGRSTSTPDDSARPTSLAGVGHAVQESVLDTGGVLGRRLEVRTEEGLDRRTEE